MKILVVASFAESLKSFRGELLKSLLARGISVHAAAPRIDRDSALRTHFDALGVQLHELRLRRTGLNPAHDLAVWIELYRLMRREQPDVILAYTIKPVIYGISAAWCARVARRYALITGLGYAFTNERNGVLTRLVQMLYRISLSGASKVFFQNPDDEALFRSLDILPMKVPSVVVNGSGVEVDRYEVAPLPNKISFLLIARLLGNKGVREYVAAAHFIRRQHPQVKFHLVGWIDDNPDAIPLIELDAWIANSDVEFWGRLDDVRPAIAAASVYVLPSYREGTPRTVLEAMSMGRPIITTDTPGCRQTVIEGSNGFLIPAKSEAALIEAMQKFIDTPELIHQMGRSSRKIAEEKYDVYKVNMVMLREMEL